MINLGADLTPLDFLTTIVALYVVVDPIGNVPLFVALTAKLDKTRKRRVLILSVLVAASVLVLFATFGIEIFGYFGVRLGDFVIASGLILTAFSLYQLLRPYEQTISSNGLEVAIVPLAVPFLAGPASISYVLLLSKYMGVFPTLFVIFTVSVLTLFTLYISEFILKILGMLGVRVLEKIMLIISVAIGISLIRRGLQLWSAELLT